MVESLPTTADGLKVTLTCPDCGQSGLVDWKNLKNAIGCAKCGCQFVIGRNGQVTSQADLPHVRYSCPRCKQSEWIPAAVAARGTECAGCKLPLVRGPDQRLMSVREAEDRRREAVAASGRRRLVDSLSRKFVNDHGRVNKRAVATCATGLVALVIAVGFAVHSWFDRSPERLAQEFVQTCLAGDWESAPQYFDFDAVQQASFDRWRLRYFSSILDRHRPAGDRVHIQLKLLEETVDMRTFLVTLKSDFIGSRTQVQKWREQDGKWVFDARGTLAQEERPRQVRDEASRPKFVPRRRS